uniref:Uncharacterized protein n=1 Tax=Trichobilharzia regenti TaxID=157069 RepID=A0AA85IV22_TRIRE|nr:unnamed protein product [Trichobilharzia regenti]
MVPRSIPEFSICSICVCMADCIHHEYSFTACSPASSNGRIGSFLEFDYEIKGLELIIAVRIQLNMPRSTFDSATGEFYILFDLVSE